MCADADFVPRVSYRSNDYDVIRGFVRALGIALVPVMGHVEDPGVVTARVAGAPCTATEPPGSVEPLVCPGFRGVRLLDFMPR